MAGGKKMRNTPFAKWVLSHADDLNLKVQEATWTKDWVPGYYSLHSNIKIGSQNILGHGLAKSQDLAFVKSAAEAIERAYCIENGIHTNGVAAFTDIEGAKTHAANELKERDAFLCHYLTNFPFVRKLEIHSFDLAIEKLKENNIKITALQMKTPPNENGVVCLATPINNNHNFSSIIGLGYSDNLQCSLDKAFLECLESTVAYIYEGKNENIETNTLTTPLDHKKLFLTPKYKNDILELIENVNPDKTPISEFDTQFNEMKSDNPLFQDLPLVVMRSISNESQPMFYGETHEDKINFRRLKQFTNQNVENEKINPTPHCIG
ncbi:MAG: YcaO-like family protein [Pseudobdellovibrionaceae bacterium]|nr:MAG: YcaO-like family protein [Pseudobdellovibrionaceae bacterium]